MTSPATTPTLTAPTLTDGTVTLRPHHEGDLLRVEEQSTDPATVGWTQVPVPYSAEDARFFALELCPGWWASDTEWVFAVEADGTYAATVTLRNEGDGVAELAYAAHPSVRGTGVVERALRVLLAYGFEQRGVRTVYWRANVGNWASRKVAWKVGFSFDGTVRQWLPQRGALHDGWVGTLLAGEAMSPRTPWLDNPVVEGDGVRLRPFTDADVPRIVEGIGDTDVQYWLAFMPRDPDEAAGRRYVETVTERLATNHTITWAFSDPADDLLLGVVGIYRMDGEPELGYWSHPAARGRGLTTRAARLAVEHAFGTLGLPRLAAYASVPNAASRRVLESVGMRPTGVLRSAARTGAGEVVDLASYDLLASEWRG
ncbi:MAG: GNAT family N-acetyltransferase [Nocardioides sp.]